MLKCHDFGWGQQALFPSRSQGVEDEALQGTFSRGSLCANTWLKAKETSQQVNMAVLGLHAQSCSLLHVMKLLFTSDKVQRLCVVQGSWYCWQTAMCMGLKDENVRVAGCIHRDVAAKPSLSSFPWAVLTFLGRRLLHDLHWACVIDGEKFHLWPHWQNEILPFSQKEWLPKL